MVTYMTCQAKPPFTVGIREFSKAEVFRRLGLLEEPKVEVPQESNAEVVIEPQEEPVVETPTEEVTEEVPTAGTPLSAIITKKNYIAALNDSNINTVEELVAYLESGKSLSEIQRLSEAAIKSISEKLEQWQKEQKATKLTE